MKITIGELVIEGTPEELATYKAMDDDFAKADICEDECCAVEPETIEFEGEQYHKVNREPREGDVVIFRETTSNYFTNGEPYEVVNKDGDINAIDEDGDDILQVYNDGMGRTRETVDVYEPVVVSKPVPSNPKLKAGDYVVFSEVEEWEEDIKLEKPYEVKVDEDGDVYIIDDAGDKRFAWYEDDDYSYELVEGEALKWAKLGRKVNELRKGDIIRVKNPCGARGYSRGQLTEVVGDCSQVSAKVEDRDGGYYLVSAELVAPAESVLS